MKGTIALKRYVTAAIEFARENNALESLYKDMKNLYRLVDCSEELNYFFQNPLIRDVTKMVLFKELLPSADGVSLKVIQLLIKNGRIFYIKAFGFLVISSLEKEKGIIKVSITTSIPITKEISEDVKNKLSKTHNGDVTLTNKIDHSILGGFIIKIEDTEYDGSILGKLNRLDAQFSTQ